MSDSGDFLGQNYAQKLRARSAELWAAGLPDRAMAFELAARVCAEAGYQECLRKLAGQIQRHGNTPEGKLAREVYDWAYYPSGGHSTHDKI